MKKIITMLMVGMMVFSLPMQTIRAEEEEKPEEVIEEVEEKGDPEEKTEETEVKNEENSDSADDDNNADADITVASEPESFTQEEENNNAELNDSGVVKASDFDDTTFGTYVITQFDKDNDNELSAAEVADAKELTVTDNPSPITSLKGIEKLSSLEKLEIKDCKKLGSEVIGNDAPNYVLTNLTTLTISNCTMKSLTIKYLGKLASFTCTGTTLEADAGADAELNISTNVSLTKVVLSNNTIKADSSKTGKIFINWNNTLSDIQIEKNTLKGKNAAIYIYDNNTADLSGLNVSVLNNKFYGDDTDGVFIADNYSLQTVDCNENEFNAPTRNWIDFQDNKSNIGINAVYNVNKNIFKTDCKENRIDVTKDTNVTTVNAKDNNDIDWLYLKEPTLVTTVDCSNSSIESLVIDNVPSLAPANLKLGNSKKVTLSGLGLTSLDLSSNTDIEILDVSKNKLTSLDLSGLTKLKELYIQGNNITELDVSDTKLLDAIKTINASSPTSGTAPDTYYEAKDGTNICWFDTKTHIHHPVKTDKVDANCTTAGTKEYYSCDYAGATAGSCKDKKYSDAALTTEITINIAALGHDWAGWNTDASQHEHQCNRCAAIEKGPHVFNGGLKCSTCGYTKAATVYSIINGDRQILVKGNIKDTTMRCDGEFGKFTGFAVDGNTLSSSDYTAVSGSTIVTIKATYLNTLPLGKHTVQFYYSDGSAKGEFSIIAPAYEVPTDGYVTPKTGDETNMLMWLGLMFISGLGVITFVRKKA